MKENKFLESKLMKYLYDWSVTDYIDEIKELDPGFLVRMQNKKKVVVLIAVTLNVLHLLTNYPSSTFFLIMINFLISFIVGSFLGYAIGELIFKETIPFYCIRERELIKKIKRIRQSKEPNNELDDNSW